MISSRFSLTEYAVLIEINEKIQERVSKIATAEVSSSMICVSVMLAICSEVITKIQNPSRFADVFNICCDVLFAI